MKLCRTSVYYMGTAEEIATWQSKTMVTWHSIRADLRHMQENRFVFETGSKELKNFIEMLKASHIKYWVRTLYSVEEK